MEVITHEPVCHRCLGAYCLEGGVAAKSALGGIKAGIADAPHTYATIIVLCIMYEPVYRVVGIRCLIYLLAFFGRVVRAHIHKLALTHIPATNIL